jgi:hypothetical protein
VQRLSIRTDDVDTLTADGRVVHLRDLDTGDREAVQALHDSASDRSLYLRFFSANREAARRYARELT